MTTRTFVASDADKARAMRGEPWALTKELKPDYTEFIRQKSQRSEMHGFEPLWMPDFLFPFQTSLVEWSIRKGRSAIFADCGLGKTPMQLVWAHNVLQKTNKPSLILTPLAVAQQTEREAEKFGIDAKYSRDGRHSGGIVITNYERLHMFDSNDFVGVVCDESSILKNYGGARRKRITRFMSKLPYRLLCTATAAPNDYIELGTSSEALAELSHSDMLTRFFRQLDDKGQKAESRHQADAEALIGIDHNYFQKLSYRVSQTIGQWRLKHHAVAHFWRWVASWATACRMPSDLGFDDDGFVLPELRERDHVIKTTNPPEGMLFTIPAVGIADERAERRRTLDQRCDFVANLVHHDRPVVVWCHMNDEADRLEEMIEDGLQIAGRTPDDKKVELYNAFQDGDLRVLIIKPKIGAWGLNWQHCNHVVTFASHSYEQYYQSVRRCWRFGQENPVELDVIATEGEIRVLANMRSKAKKADAMFEAMVKSMNDAERIERHNPYTKTMETPTWL
jgi:SNF2 family DNA or RNA helicase